MAAMAVNLRDVSFLQPTPALVAQLNGERPTIVSTYPTVADLLSEEAAAGRLRIAPREVWTGGETLTAGMRRLIEGQFGCPVIDSYGASEFLSLASQCRCGALHLNSDWAILEPVDEQLRPVPPGVTGCSTLLTNLANFVQPIIRYELGDRVLVQARQCACGSPLPVIEVQGRCDDMLTLQRADGASALAAARADDGARG
jgi:phenylacetate-coenzyme A ligase PaaK-like adenylate-forming protein